MMKLNWTKKAIAEHIQQTGEVPLPQGFFISPEFMALSGSAMKVFLDFLGQYTGKNNGNLIMPISQSTKRLNISSNTCKKALKELEANGFIQITEAETNNTPRKYALLPFPI